MSALARPSSAVPVLGLLMAPLVALSGGCAGCTDPGDDDDSAIVEDDDDTGDDDSADPPDDFPPTENVGMFLSMALTADGVPVISYYAKEEGALLLARGEVGSTTLAHEEVEGMPGFNASGVPSDSGDVGQWSSLVLADDGHELIAYRDEGDTGMKFAERTADGWEIERAAGAGSLANAGIYADLELDSSGNPAVAHYDARKKTLEIAWRIGGTWSNETVDEGGLGPDAEAAGTTEADVGSHPDLLWVGDRWEILYYDTANGDLKRAVGTPGAWTTEILVGAGSDAGAWPAGVVSDGRLQFISYQAGPQKSLWLASWQPDTETWSTEAVDTAPYTGADSILLPGGERPTIIYQDAQANDLRRAEFTAETGQWTVAPVDGYTDGAWGYFNAAARDPSGTVHIAGFDYTSRTFRYSQQ